MPRVDDHPPGARIRVRRSSTGARGGWESGEGRESGEDGKGGISDKGRSLDTG